jgi:putative membrane protein
MGGGYVSRSVALRVRRLLLVVGSSVCALGPGVAYAHEGVPPAPHDLWRTWSWEPSILLGLALAAWLYTRGVRVLWRRAGVGRGIRRGQVCAFVGGLLALFVALISPLDGLGSALFAGHMIQHLVLTEVAAPLLALGAPILPFLWGVPYAWRGTIARWWHRASRVRAAWHGLTHPLPVWGLYAVTLWAWHIPALYQATLRSEWVHIAQHSSFLGTALLFWWVLLHPGRQSRLDAGLGILVLFTTMLHSNILGIVMTFSARPWYPAYASTVAAWGLTPEEDQQLGGLIMWIPGGLVYVLAAVALGMVWLQAIETTMRQRETQK